MQLQHCKQVKQSWSTETEALKVVDLSVVMQDIKVVKVFAVMEEMKVVELEMMKAIEISVQAEAAMIVLVCTVDSRSLSWFNVT